jgi:hypothetical protein
MQFKKTITVAFALLAFAAPGLVPASAHASFFMDFEGLQDLETVNTFYDGGFGGNGSGPGPDFGVTFTSTTLAIIDADAGGSGNFGGEPSASTIMFWLEGGNSFMNVADGFDTGFSFFYTAINATGFINVWDGFNGTGNILGSFNLPLTPFNGAPDPTGQFSPLVPVGVGFSGLAKSVEFGGSANQIGFDNITFGDAAPQSSVPEPASLLLLGMGLAGAGGLKGRLRRRNK